MNMNQVHMGDINNTMNMQKRPVPVPNQQYNMNQGQGYYPNPNPSKSFSFVIDLGKNFQNPNAYYNQPNNTGYGDQYMGNQNFGGYNQYPGTKQQDEGYYYADGRNPNLR